MHVQGVRRAAMAKKPASSYQSYTLPPYQSYLFTILRDISAARLLQIRGETIIGFLNPHSIHHDFSAPASPTRLTTFMYY